MSIFYTIHYVLELNNGISFRERSNELNVVCHTSVRMIFPSLGLNEWDGFDPLKADMR